MVWTWQDFSAELDRHDAAGWLLLVLGLAVVGVTVLVPAWLDVRQLAAQDHLLQRRARMLEVKHTNYQAFLRAVDRGEPLLIQRLAWHHLNLKPAGTQTLHPYLPVEPGPAPPADRWVHPEAPPLPAGVVETATTDSRLMRLLTGRPRIWVLGFGAWLILMGVLSDPAGD